MCAELLGSNPASGTLQSLAIEGVSFVAALPFLCLYANDTPRQYSGTDMPQGQPQAVSAVQPLDSFPFPPAGLASGFEPNR